MATASESGHAILVLKNLRVSDHGIYECVVGNDFAQQIQQTQIFIEDTVPQPAESVTVLTGAFDAKIRWNPGFDGGHAQHFLLK